MLEIERVRWLTPSYTIHDDHGHAGLWARRRFKEGMSGELDGARYDFVRDGRKRFVLTHAGQTLATADAGRRGGWVISAGGSAYGLRRRSAWRSEMLLFDGDTTVGSIRKARAPRGKLVCDLPAELSPPVQAFVGLVVLTLSNRAAASSGAGAVAVTGSAL